MELRRIEGVGVRVSSERERERERERESCGAYCPNESDPILK
jgi:hypothetical protein